MVQSYSNSDEPIMKNVPSKHHVIYAAWDKIVKSLVEVLYSFIEQARNSGRHVIQGGTMAD